MKAITNQLPGYPSKISQNHLMKVDMFGNIPGSNNPQMYRTIHTPEGEVQIDMTRPAC